VSAPERPALGLPGRLDGIDVSWVQQTIDYAKVAAAGFRFAVYKAAEGLKAPDSTALAHAAGFRSVGMYALPYLFLHPAQGAPELQVRNLMRAMGDTWPGRVCLDIETRQAPESNLELVRFLELAVEECMRWGVLAPTVYTFPDFARRLQPELSRSETLGCCPLWMASFPRQPWAPTPADDPYVPLPWASWSLWQYGADNGYRVPGVFGDCDRDVFNGDEGAFRAWLGLPASATIVAGGGCSPAA
jgi:lysozyme